MVQGDKIYHSLSRVNKYLFLTKKKCYVTSIQIKISSPKSLVKNVLQSVSHVPLVTSDYLFLVSVFVLYRDIVLRLCASLPWQNIEEEHIIIYLEVLFKLPSNTDYGLTLSYQWLQIASWDFSFMMSVCACVFLEIDSVWAERVWQEEMGRCVTL